MIDSVQTGGRGGDEVERNCLARAAAFHPRFSGSTLLAAGPTAGREAVGRRRDACTPGLVIENDGGGGSC